jgi:hypothetical protein
MVRGLVSQIDPKKEPQFWTTLIIVLLKEQRYTWLREIIRSITITLLKYPTWGGILPENNTDVDNDHE